MCVISHSIIRVMDTHGGMPWANSHDFVTIVRNGVCVRACVCVCVCVCAVCESGIIALLRTIDLESHSIIHQPR